MTFLLLILILILVLTAVSYNINTNRLIRNNIRNNNNNHKLYLTPNDKTVYQAKIQLALANKYSISKFLNDFSNESIQGVYTIINDKDEVQYVGISLNIVKDIKRHHDFHGSIIVHCIRVQSFAQPNIDALTAYKNELVRQTNPWGNALGATGWNIDSTSNTDNIINLPNEKIINDEDKLKSLKQTIAEVTAEDAIISPFDIENCNNNNNDMTMKIAASDNILEFSKENVDKVLNEIRPYLIADGGNVAVAEIDVEKYTVSLILEGACGSCPSSTTTMKMGIERVLKENFPNLTEVINLSQSLEPVKPTELTKESVESALQQILSAINGLGGKVFIESVDAIAGSVVIKYQGPPKLKQGVELVIKDVKYVKSVEIKSFDD